MVDMVLFIRLDLARFQRGRASTSFWACVLMPE